MDVIANFNKPIIGDYSPISAKGGRRRKSIRIRTLRNKRNKRNKRNNKSNKSRTRRHR